jgi:HEAT repeat protein
VRASAVSALGSLGVKDKEVVEKIIAKLGDEYWSVRASAYKALEKLTTE